MNRFLDRGALCAAVLFAVVLSIFPAGARGQEQAPATRVAVIDVQRLLLESERGRKAVAELQNLREQKQAEGVSRQQEIEDLQAQIDEGRLSLSEERIAQLEQSLEEKVIALRRFQDDANRDLEKSQEEEFQDIEARMMPIINQAGEDLGYSLIFNKFNSGLLYALDEVDITDIILERFNASEGSSESSGGS